MTTFRTVLFLSLSAAALACGGNTAAPETTPPTVKPTDKVDIVIASVTLADDCGSGPTTAPPADAPVITAQAEQEPISASQHSSAKRAAGASISADRACEQSSIQLRVANPTGAAAKVAIQKIEVLDEAGNKVADLTPREPSKWTDDAAYAAWDEQVAPSSSLAVSYALNAPYLARGATYTVRVIVAADGGAQTLEQPVTLHAEASLPPGVVT